MVRGRAITVAVIGPGDLADDIAAAGRDFSGLEVRVLTYERVDQAAGLYAQACAGAERPLRADAVLFTGPLGYRRGTGGAPFAATPTAYVPYSPLWLYAPLFAIRDRALLRRVSLDSLDPAVLAATYGELGLPLEDVEIYDPLSGDPGCGGPAPGDPPADEVAAFHRRALATGRATCALTGILAVYRLLQATGAPCAWLVPSRVAITEALEKLRYVAEGMQARGSQIVVGLARSRENDPSFGAARLRLRAHELLLSQVEEFDGHLIDAGSGDFQFFAHYHHWPLGAKLDATGLAMSAGVGLGATAGEAGSNARAALDEALRGEGSACFVMLEDRRLVGPLGPAIREFHPETASLERTLVALDGLVGDFTSADLAVRLRLGRRTAHRVLLKLRESGRVIDVGWESSGERGRPRRVFRLGGRNGPGEGGGQV
jgi:hypothetical protein